MRSNIRFAVIGLCAWLYACGGSETNNPGPSAAGASSGKACGARAGSTCSDNEYCAYIEGQLCGAADASATCKPRPNGCAEIFMPVCGCDGKTYGNPCEAASKGTGVNTGSACAQ